MRLLFKQRFFSWLDSYDIYDEGGNTMFTVKGRLSFGHCLDVYDRAGRRVGTVKEELLHLLPHFRMYMGDEYIGQMVKKFTFFKPAFRLDCNGWQVDGDIFEWDYDVTDANGSHIAHLSKELFHFTDTYVMDIETPANALTVLMIALVIDAAKCSDGNN